MDGWRKGDIIIPRFLKMVWIYGCGGFNGNGKVCFI